MKILTKLLTLNFDFGLFVLLAIGFIAFTIIGTVSHESGHYVVARCLGYEAGINYKSTYFFLKDTNDEAFIKSHWQLNKKQIKAKQTFPDQEKWDSLLLKRQHDSFWITLGGAMQTMLTGTIGLILLFFLRRRYFSSQKLPFFLWVLIFVTLFWLRQAANFFVGVTNLMLHGSIRSHSDEFILAGYLNFPRWSISIITASIALIVLAFVIFKFIPQKQRLTFILAGLVGGVSGYLLWLTFFGKFIMP
ncbi:MAG: hypothetical protein NTX61_05365 [Bacteroidetes bacterium]|nr:hypothetical protein [Bacteroidota bacterium]